MKRSGNNRGGNAALGAVAGAMLLWLGTSPPVAAAQGQLRVSVVYEAPWLFVEARGVSVTEVLRAIGAKVGFAVVEAGAPRESLTMSLKDATLETVLRQLLRAENYVLVYRSDEGGVAGTRLKTIVLLGAAAPGPTVRPPAAAASPGAPPSEAPLTSVVGGLFRPSTASPGAPPSETPLEALKEALKKAEQEASSPAERKRLRQLYIQRLRQGELPPATAPGGEASSVPSSVQPEAQEGGEPTAR